MGDKDKRDETEKGNALTLTLRTEAKEDAAAAFTDMLSRMVKASNVVKNAETDDEKGEERLPVELLNELKVVGKAVTDLLLSHAVAKGSGSVAEGLVSLSEMSLLLAEEVATSGEVDSEAVAKMEQMASMLETITKAVKGESEEDESEEESEETSKGASSEESATSEEEAPTEKNDDPRFKELADGLAETQKSIASLADSVKSIAENIGKGGKSEEEPPKAADVDENDDVKKKLAELQKGLESMRSERDELARKLDAATEEPPGSNASQQSDVKKNDDGQMLFPLVYNDPLHDPQPEA